MTNLGRFRVATVLAIVAVVSVPAFARALTFDERVEAQAAIERVYRAHRFGATVPFDEAVPRELERMARGTRLPDRLRELFAALDDDPVLILECLARPALVDRLTRGFYALDPRFHEVRRSEADGLRAALSGGTLDAWRDDPRRDELVLVRQTDETASDTASRTGARPDVAPDGTRRLTLAGGEFDAWRSRFVDGAGTVLPVREDRDAFRVDVLVEDGPDRMRVAAYRVTKTPWDTWWASVAPGLDNDAVATVAPAGATLPASLGGERAVVEDGGGARGSAGSYLSSGGRYFVDTDPPELTVTLDPSILWPPDRRMVDVTATLVATDACVRPAVTLESIVSNEAGGSDDVQGAESGTDDTEFALRAERSGSGPGRTYTVTYAATDGSGNRSEASATAFVPHDQGNRPVMQAEGQSGEGITNLGGTGAPGPARPSGSGTDHTDRRPRGRRADRE